MSVDVRAHDRRAAHQLDLALIAAGPVLLAACVGLRSANEALYLERAGVAFFLVATAILIGGLSIIANTRLTVFTCAAFGLAYLVLLSAGAIWVAVATGAVLV